MAIVYQDPTAQLMQMAQQLQQMRARREQLRLQKEAALRDAERLKLSQQAGERAEREQTARRGMENIQAQRAAREAIQSQPDIQGIPGTAEAAALGVSEAARRAGQPIGPAISGVVDQSLAQGRALAQAQETQDTRQARQAQEQLARKEAMLIRMMNQNVWGQPGGSPEMPAVPITSEDRQAVLQAAAQDPENYFQVAEQFLRGRGYRVSDAEFSAYAQGLRQEAQNTQDAAEIFLRAGMAAPSAQVLQEAAQQIDQIMPGAGQYFAPGPPEAVMDNLQRFGEVLLSELDNRLLILDRAYGPQAPEVQMLQATREKVAEAVEQARTGEGFRPQVPGTAGPYKVPEFTADLDGEQLAELNETIRLETLPTLDKTLQSTPKDSNLVDLMQKVEAYSLEELLSKPPGWVRRRYGRPGNIPASYEDAVTDFAQATRMILRNARFGMDLTETGLAAWARAYEARFAQDPGFWASPLGKLVDGILEATEIQAELRTQPGVPPTERTATMGDTEVPITELKPGQTLRSDRD